MNGEYANSNYYGYDEESIKKMYQGLYDAYEALVSNVGGELQTDVINPIGDFWYAKEAQNTGDAIVNVINNEFTDALLTTYGQLTEYLEGVAKTWAEYTQNTPVTNTVGNSSTRIKVNRETIKENLDGKFVGINSEKATSYTEGLSGVKTKITSAISETYSKIRELAPFVGGQQEQAVLGLIKKLEDSVTDMFSFVIDGSGNFAGSNTDFKGIKKAMEDWTLEYQERARKAKEAMEQ